MSHEELKQEIITTCLRLVEKEYLFGTYGNVSVRIDGGLIITPSRVDYQTMSAEDMVTVSLKGQKIDGSRLPSSELEVHRQIYIARDDVRAIVHSHSLFATALSCAHVTVPVIVEEQSQVLGSEIQCTRYVPAGQHHKLGDEVARTIGRAQAVLLANHGTLSCGRSLSEAEFTCEVVERVAQMYVYSKMAGGSVQIPKALVTSERERWLFKYGTTKDAG